MRNKMRELNPRAWIPSLNRYATGYDDLYYHRQMNGESEWWSGEEEYYPCCTSSGFALPYSEDGYEVIGNIHENPELIGKEKE